MRVRRPAAVGEGGELGADLSGQARIEIGVGEALVRSGFDDQLPPWVHDAAVAAERDAGLVADGIAGDHPDLLFDGAEFHEFTHARVDTGHDHGAGDTLAAATASALAHGCSVPEAVAFAKRWVTRGLEAAYPLGAGHGPVNPLWRVEITPEAPAR